jgi:hypothetical protein
MEFLNFLAQRGHVTRDRRSDHNGFGIRLQDCTRKAVSILEGYLIAEKQRAGKSEKDEKSN